MITTVGSLGGSLRDRLAGLPEPERVNVILELVLAEVAAVVGPEKSQALEADSSWRLLGIYRELAADLREYLSRATQLPIPATVFFDYPTPAALVGYLNAELLGYKRAPVEMPHPEGIRGDDDPIAIVGMACRFPGNVRSPDDLWQLAAEGGDAISAFPEGRGWDIDALYHPDAERLSTTYSRGGGFLHDVDQFDAGFFGISPREAIALDPQQRLLLEMSWEALERAGIDPFSLAGSKTGVYVGIAYQDYGPRWHEPPEGYQGYLLMGSLTSAASGRISYTWGLEGPAMTVDTACSSSLVTLHLAAQALRGRECSLALAGGATVMATPGVFLEFSRKRGLAPDGRCKSFSADADGTGWGEGAGMLVLERLSDARRSGHRVLALIRGSALNQDGASNGLTAPNGISQQRVIRQTLANAGLSPEEVDAVEAHGTGTTLGDPIEAQALIATYGQNRRQDRPLWLGSLKSNIGHSQAAAVVGAVIKMVLAMRHGVLPKTLHVTDPSPHVDWSAGAVSVLSEQRPWPRTDRPRRVGISAFGVSGTNGHLILEEPPPPDDHAAGTAGRTATDSADEAALPWLLSGREATALRSQADRLRAHVSAHPELRPVDIGYALAGKTRFKHRAVLVAAERADFLRGLEALATEGTMPGLVSGVAQTHTKVAILFSGQGSQRHGMGRELYEKYPVFGHAWDDICARFDTHLDRPLRSVTWPLDGSGDAEWLDQTAYTQAALFAFQVCLFRLVEEWGISPDLFLGHSIGELTAAHVAGVLSLDDACTLVAARGRLMQACRSDGAMVSIRATEDEVRSLLQGQDAQVGIAAVNGPRATVIAGDEAAVGRLAARWQAKGYHTKRLPVSHAFHSPHMDAMLDQFRQVAETLSFHAPTVPIVSNLTGAITTADELCSPDYWVRHVRETVRFVDGMRRLETEGVTAFFELGPDATLTAMSRACLTEQHSEHAVLVPALRASRPESQTLLTALAELHVHGITVDWDVLFDGRDAAWVELPTYAFQRQRYWLEAPRLATTGRDLAPDDGSEWRYRVIWKPAVVPTARLTGTWLLVTGNSAADHSLDTMLTTVLVDHDVQVISLALDDAELDRDHLAAHLGTVLANGVSVDGVLSLLALDETPQDGQDGMTRGAVGTIALAQAWAEARLDAPLWCATRGAVTVGDSDPLRSLSQAMIWGLGRSVGLEYPRGWGGLVDFPEILDEQALRRACGALAGLTGEDQLAIRPNGVFVRRVIRADPLPPAPPPWRPRGTALITGGTGAVGAHAARWLARHGAEHLVLVSRSGLAAPGAVELRDELTALGAAVTVAACDVADRAGLAQLITSITAERPLNTVVHAAGTSGRFAPLTEVSPAEFADVVIAKMAGALHLDALLEGHPLDAFVLVSSIAGVWGSGSQAAYAAGNAYLDALAHRRRARGLAATAVAWGPWAQGGMAADPTISNYLLQRGLPAMAPQIATTALWQAVAAGDTTVAVADVDWPRFLQAFTAVRASHLFEDLAEPDAAARQIEPGADQAVTSWRHRLTGTSGSERDQILLELVRREAADILGHAAPEDLDPTCQFLDLGFDSLAAVELGKRLTRALGLTLSTTVVLDHPTAAALAEHLATELAGDLAPASVDGAPGQTPSAYNGQPGLELESVRFLFRRACELSMFDEGHDMLKSVAKLRPIFHSAAEFGKDLKLVRLAKGPTTPALVCFPPFVAPSGPHNYARLALSLDGLRDVYSLSHPGFGTGESIPFATELIIEMYAEAVRTQLADTPFAVLGYSSGGWLAHAVAAHLETVGVFPTTVVLLDSFALRDNTWDHIGGPLTTLTLNDHAYALMTADQLTAMVAYFRLFEGWRPTMITTPVLLVRAAGYVPEWQTEPMSEESIRASWDFPHEVLEVSGHHFSIMHQNVTTTALAIHEWLCSRQVSSPDDPPPAAKPDGSKRHRGHIAMFSVPAHGHVNPSLGIIRELVDRGYRVTYSINEEFAPQVEAAGATPVLYRSTMPSESDPTSAYPTDPIAMASMALEEAMAVLPQMEAAYDKDRPDLFLYDVGGYAAPVLATRWDIPIIQLSPTFVAWEGYDQDMVVLAADPTGAAFRAKFAAWLRNQGIDESTAEFAGRPRRCIVLIPRILQPNAAKVAQTYTFVGPCFDERSYQGNWKSPGNGRPVLLISLGSAYTDQAEFYRECIAAFEDLNWHVVMAIGRHVDRDQLGVVPNNIEVHQWVPQLSVLSQADAFITHAGMGGTIEGLYHGVPMVAVPQAMDQFINAKRIAELGVGRCLPREHATAATLREAVLTVSGDQGVAARLRQIQEEMRRAGGTTAAADLIEQHLKVR